ncbi:Hpt domain-containing protein [Limibaculum sp. M0105]|uniref:Hpt domain-containing protein n=1 Tax=Thermohalobaculum xanthum TaxID=2753746 RepID=A0A8J7M3I7_9RHOB|nr:Hpt domain-containing protein [Thermohalobaculum xanthum]MBK0397616.1 Hpt domain-containing protein [Thermohalobaculum xanthum]
MRMTGGVRMLPGGIAGALQRAGIGPDDGTLDVMAFETILAEFGPDLLSRVAASFRAEAQGALDALDTAVAARDAVAAGQQCHFIKGSALYLALGRLSGLCERLEGEARSGECPGPDAAASLRAEVIHGLDALIALGLLTDR